MIMSETPAAAPQQSKTRQVVVLVVFLAVVAACFGGIFYATRNASANAEVGDCMEETGGYNIEVIECGEPAAKYKVVGRVEDKLKGDADDACDPFDRVDSVYWEGEDGEEGLVLCLGLNR
jgi:hypothetical protein